MSHWQRPLGLTALIGILVVAGGMTIALASMVWSRARLLESGAEIVLKTAPVDPRDLLLGYYAQLGYDISTIRLDNLKEGNPAVIGDGFHVNEAVYVRLRADDSGYWSPVALYRRMPAPVSRSVVIRGIVTANACQSQLEESQPPCQVGLRYGIEKFFAPQEKAQAIEATRLGVDQSRIDEIDAELRRLEQRRQELASPDKPLDAAGRDAARREAKALAAQLAGLRKERDDLWSRVRQQQASAERRIAVIVRVSPETGEAAIAGLRIDGRKVYEERLF
jgi:uncharacterized membrane-anchored protein